MDPNANDRTESLESHLSKLADDMEQFAEQIEVQTKRPALLMVAERLRGKAEVIRLALATG